MRVVKVENKGKGFRRIRVALELSAPEPPQATLGRMSAWCRPCRWDRGPYRAGADSTLCREATLQLLTGCRALGPRAALSRAVTPGTGSCRHSSVGPSVSYRAGRHRHRAVDARVDPACSRARRTRARGRPAAARHSVAIPCPHARPGCNCQPISGASGTARASRHPGRRARSRVGCGRCPARRASPADRRRRALAAARSAAALAAAARAASGWRRASPRHSKRDRRRWNPRRRRRPPRERAGAIGRGSGPTMGGRDPPHQAREVRRRLGSLVASPPVRVSGAPAGVTATRPQ
jgi:hypothetical protein